MNYELTGTVLKIGEERHISDNFSFKEIVVDTSDAKSKFSNPVPIHFINQRIEKLEEAQISLTDKVKVTFVIDGKHGKGKHEGKVFVKIVGLEIDHV